MTNRLKTCTHDLMPDQAVIRLTCHTQHHAQRTKHDAWGSDPVEAHWQQVRSGQGPERWPPVSRRKHKQACLLPAVPFVCGTNKQGVFVTGSTLA